MTILLGAYYTSIFFSFVLICCGHSNVLHSFPTRRSSDLLCSSFLYLLSPFLNILVEHHEVVVTPQHIHEPFVIRAWSAEDGDDRSEEHTSELQSLRHLVCRLLLEKKNL